MQDSVLITGANSGIGLFTTRKLVKEGYHVYAAYRDRSALNDFEKISKYITPIRIDVTDQELIDDAYVKIQDSENNLIALVNNAGIFEGYPLLYSTIEDFEKVVNVNLYGVHRMTKSFVPLLIKSKGRIINIGSISGIVSDFASGFYSASKHALEAYSDTLSKEMKKFGVHVCIVEPGNYQTSIVDKYRQKLIERLQSSHQTWYKEEFQAYIEENKDQEILFPQPDSVATTIHQAISTTNPQIRYLVTDNQLETDFVIGKMILELLQLNYNHKFSYNKEQLVTKLKEMFDEDLLQKQFTI